MDRGENEQVSISGGEGRGLRWGEGCGRHAEERGGEKLAQLPCFVLTASRLLSLFTHLLPLLSLFLFYH